MSNTRRFSILAFIVVLISIFATLTRHYELWFWFGVTNFIGGALYGLWFWTMILNDTEVKTTRLSEYK